MKLAIVLTAALGAAVMVADEPASPVDVRRPAPAIINQLPATRAEVAAKGVAKGRTLPGVNEYWLSRRNEAVVASREEQGRLSMPDTMRPNMQHLRFRPKVKGGAPPASAFVRTPPVPAPASETKPTIKPFMRFFGY